MQQWIQINQLKFACISLTLYIDMNCQRLISTSRLSLIFFKVTGEVRGLLEAQIKSRDLTTFTTVHSVIHYTFIYQKKKNLTLLTLGIC